MKIYQLRRRQELPTTVDDVWDFFADPRNMQSITPKYLDVQVARGYEEQRLEPGLIIAYKVRPYGSIRLDWVTEITYIKEKEYFIDEQRFGPFKLWHHKHSFREIPGGVLVQDVINYALHLGPVGRVANAILVRRRLNEIFTYREKALNKLFRETEPGLEPGKVPQKERGTRSSSSQKVEEQYTTPRVPPETVTS